MRPTAVTSKYRLVHYGVQSIHEQNFWYIHPA